jgi:hypothetical protein
MIFRVEFMMPLLLLMIRPVALLSMPGFYGNPARRKRQCHYFLLCNKPQMEITWITFAGSCQKTRGVSRERSSENQYQKIVSLENNCPGPVPVVRKNGVR